MAGEDSLPTFSPNEPSPSQRRHVDTDEGADGQETVWSRSYEIIFSGVNSLGIYTLFLTLAVSFGCQSWFHLRVFSTGEFDIHILKVLCNVSIYIPASFVFLARGVCEYIQESEVHF